MYSPVKVELRTEKGLRFSFVGYLLFVIWQILWTILIFSMRDVLAELVTDSTADDASVYNDLLIYIGPICGGLILLFIFLIILLLGLIFLYNGRLEFGEVHANNVKNGVIFLIVGFIIGTLGGGSTGLVQSEIGILLIISLIVTIITAICYSYGFMLLLKQLLDEQGFKFLKIGAILLIVINIIYLGLISAVSFNPDLFGDNGLFSAVGVGFNIIMTIPWVIFTFSFYRAFKRVQWGVIKPKYPPLYPAQYQLPMGAPPPFPPAGSELPSNTKTCPSCRFMVEQGQAKCPKCGYYFDDE